MYQVLTKLYFTFVTFFTLCNFSYTRYIFTFCMNKNVFLCEILMTGHENFTCLIVLSLNVLDVRPLSVLKSSNVVFLFYPYGEQNK